MHFSKTTKVNVKLWRGCGDLWSLRSLTIAPSRWWHGGDQHVTLSFLLCNVCRLLAAGESSASRLTPTIGPAAETRLGGGERGIWQQQEAFTLGPVSGDLQSAAAAAVRGGAPSSASFKLSPLSLIRQGSHGTAEEGFLPQPSGGSLTSCGRRLPATRSTADSGVILMEGGIRPPETAVPRPLKGGSSSPSHNGLRPADQFAPHNSAGSDQTLPNVSSALDLRCGIYFLSCTLPVFASSSFLPPDRFRAQVG